MNYPSDPRPPVQPVQEITILIAEDHDAVRQVLFTTLQLAGYHVLLARNGREALQMSDLHAGPIHLLIADLVMPHLGGLELAAQLKVRHPALKVLLVSGYLFHEPHWQSSEYAGLPFLPKPFDVAMLEHKVRALLTEPVAGEP